MDSNSATAERWSPPSGVASELLPAGMYWDAVRVPAYLGDRVLNRLGRESGAVIRDPYSHRLTWLVPPGTTQEWDVPETTCVQLLSVTQHMTVPPGWCTRSAFTHWIRDWAKYGLTDARLLYVVLDAVIRAEHGPRADEGGAGR